MESATTTANYVGEILVCNDGTVLQGHNFRKGTDVIVYMATKEVPPSGRRFNRVRFYLYADGMTEEEFDPDDTDFADQLVGRAEDGNYLAGFRLPSSASDGRHLVEMYIDGDWSEVARNWEIKDGYIRVLSEESGAAEFIVV